MSPEPDDSDEETAATKPNPADVAEALGWNTSYDLSAPSARNSNSATLPVLLYVVFEQTLRREWTTLRFVRPAREHIPTLQIHATLASAFSREPVQGTREERNIHEAEFALVCAILVFVAVIQSQNEIFSLNLDQETKACWDDVTAVWKDRPHGPSATRAARQA